MSPRIHDLPESERPREKLLREGAESLTDAQLLAILIRAGTPRRSALELGEDFLNKYGSFKGLAGRSIGEIMKIKGIGKAKAITIAAAFEIAKRVVNQVLEEKGIK